jgi:hypothetical protein
MVPSTLTGANSIYNESSTLPDGMKVGDKKELSDGRIFRLCKNGAVALAAGKLCIQGDETANHVGKTPTAAAVGVKFVTVTLGATAATANEYAEGYLVIRTTGKMYKIKAHPAADASATLQVELYDPLDVALAGTEEVDLVHNPYYGVLVAVTDQADIPVGVPPIAVTASYYFWLQTDGPCPVLIDETLGRGDTVTIGSSVAGAVEAVDAVAEPVVGHMIEAGVDTKYNLCQLCMGR